MLPSSRRFDDYRAETGEEVVEILIWQIIHFLLACAVHRYPDCRFRPLPPLLQGDLETDSALFRLQLEGREKSRGAVGDGADIEDATFPVRR